MGLIGLLDYERELLLHGERCAQEAHRVSRIMARDDDRLSGCLYEKAYQNMLRCLSPAAPVPDVALCRRMGRWLTLVYIDAHRS